MNVTTWTGQKIKAFGNWLAPEPPAPPRRRSNSTGNGFNAAAVSRLTSDWNPWVNTSINYELRLALAMMRRRSRLLCRNDDYAKKFLQMARQNIIGSGGIKLQVEAVDKNGMPNTELSSRVETAWIQWGNKRTTSITGKLSWLQFQWLFTSMVAQDGEVLIHQRAAKNRFGYSLKFLNPDYLDENHNRLLPSGNKIIMGVELNTDDKPVAYHLRKPYFDVWLSQNQGPFYERIPAEEIIHAFIPIDPDQVRGIPWLYTSMFRLKQLGAYEEAEVIAARIAASKMGFFQKPAQPGEIESDEANGSFIDEVEPGRFQELPEGYQFQAFDPSHPNSNYGGFVKSVLRGVASGLGVSYNGLAEDLEGVNYSSLRAGLLSERDNWKVLQQWAAESLHAEVYPAWLENSVLAGAFKLNAKEFRQVQEPHWTPRGFPWVDPLKDLQAIEKALALGIDSWSDIVAALGGDLEEIFQRRKQDRALAKKYGEDLDAGLKKATGSAPIKQEGDAGSDTQDSEDNQDDSNGDTAQE